MLDQHQIDIILASPGSYRFWCVYGNNGDPFFSHQPHGHVLHRVTDSEWQAQAKRGLP